VSKFAELPAKGQALFYRRKAGPEPREKKTSGRKCGGKKGVSCEDLDTKQFGKKSKGDLTSTDR